MSEALIVTAARRVDGVGSLAAVENALYRLREQGIPVTELEIMPLSHGWNTPLPANGFRSGCGPILALERAMRMLSSRQADAVLIRGDEPLRSAYALNKPQRGQLMAIYGPDCPIPEAYTQLARAYLEHRGLDPVTFKQLAEQLWQNYRRTARDNGLPVDPPPERYHYLTELFRAVDCANPVVDFQGRLLLVGSALADGFSNAVRVLGIGVDQTQGDGPDYVREIARFEHLARAYRLACRQARQEFHTAFLAGEALLDVYTCYPVIPLAFLLECGFVAGPDALADLLERYPVTVTGGMNLARAPWNNPALNALIVMVEKLQGAGPALGAVHGNGGLGYLQGVAVLERLC